MSIVPLFDPFGIWGPVTSSTEKSEFVNAQIDWKETPEVHVIKADLPGLKKEEVKVAVEDGNILQISGERKKEEEEEKDAKWRRIERSRGKFLRCFRLPQNAKMDQVKATMENGVLTVVIPKEVKKPEVKTIQISG